MAHTPGPWGIVFHGDVERIRLNGSTVYQVSDVTDPDFPEGKPRYNLADLHLMAAAPELLEACKYMRDHLVDWLDVSDHQNYSVRGMGVEDFVQWVIAKAEGRAR